MPAQSGKDLLLKIDLANDGAYVTIGGLRATRITFNASSVDITSLDSAGGWRELLAGAGVRSASLAGSGVFKDDAADAAIRAAFFAGEIKTWRVVIPDFGQIDGLFHIVELDYAGDHEGEATYGLSLASAGALTFTAI